MKIEVTSTAVEVKTGTNGRGPWEIREQTAYFFKNADDKYPQETVVTLDKNQPPYPPGFYEIDESSFFIGRYRQFNCRLKLKPVVAAAQTSRATA
jgi:hypothetical protein